MVTIDTLSLLIGFGTFILTGVMVVIMLTEKK